MLNNGKGGLTAAQSSYEAGYGVTALASGDFNGDGKLDLAVTSAATTILDGNGQGGLQQPVGYAVLGEGPSFPALAVAAADLNGDGRPDLVMSNYSDRSISVVLNRGHGTFTQGAIYKLPYPPASLAIGDFNGDGKPDVAVAMLVENQIAVLLGNGDGTFGSPVFYDSVRAPVSIVAGDFNGDGKLDLAVGGTGLAILSGNGDGTFQAPAHYEIAGSLYSLALADLNGDGYLDIVGANTLAIVVLLGNGNGNGTFQQPRFVASGHGPYSVAIADLNGDGRPDLAVVNLTASSSTVAVLLGIGDGSFQPPVEYPMTGRPIQVSVADFNGDGKPDLAVLRGTSFSVTFLLGDGKGSFQSADVADGFLVPTYPSSMTVADFNGDGKPDIAIISSSLTGLGILTNTTP